MGIRQLLIQLEIPSSAVRVQQNFNKNTGLLLSCSWSLKTCLFKQPSHPKDYSETLGRWKGFLFTRALQNDIFWFKWLNCSLFYHPFWGFAQIESEARPTQFNSRPLCEAFCTSLQVKKTGHLTEKILLSDSSAACGHPCADFTIEAKNRCTGRWRAAREWTT